MRYRPWIVPAIVLLFGLPLLPSLTEDASAGKPIFSANTLVNWVEGERSFDQIPKDIISDETGRIYVVYQSEPAFYWHVMIAHSDDGGATWSVPVRVDDVLRDGNASNDQSHQSAPRIDIANNGTIYVVWADHRDDEFTQQIRIAWSRDGENFSRSVRVDQVKEEPNWNGADPDITINDEGRIFVAWMDKNLSGAYYNVWRSFSTDGGLTWADMEYINTDGLHYRNHEWVRCVMDGDDVYVTWHDNRKDSQYRPYLAVSHDGGETFLPEKPVSDDLELYNSRQWPSPALDDSGNLYITWRDKRSGVDEIWFARSEDRGATVSMNTRVTIAPEGADDWYPCTDAYGDGTVLVAWQRLVPTTDSMDDGEIFYLNSTDGGRTWDKIMRVDDTDRYYDDFTVQSVPLISHDPAGRALVIWSDERSSAAYYKDIFFSRHSGTNTGPNNRPRLYDIMFWGNFTFNPKIGSAVSPFFFQCNYSDPDNDMPLEGYPRVMVFSDTEGEHPLLPVPAIMEKVFLRDDDYIDGAFYKAVLNISYQGQTYYRIEAVEERNPEPLLSPVIEGPVIDATPPTVEVLSPVAATWMSTNIVRCSAMIVDTEGGHVNPSSIKVRKSYYGLEGLEKGVPVNGVTKMDNNTYTAWADVRLEAGDENYIMFEAYDRVRNGPGVSEPLNVWVDPNPPEFTRVVPSRLQLYETVNCSIDWVDHIPGSTSIASSGLNTSTVRYAYRTTTGPLSEWMEPEGMVPLPQGTYRYWTHLVFANEGVYNFIKWKAVDNIGLVRETEEFKVRIEVPMNYPPRFLGDVYPDAVASSTPHFFWDDAFDEENDTLFYRVMVLKGELQWTNWFNVGERTFFDIPNDKALEPGQYILRVNVTDNIGGYDIMDHTFRILDTGTPPPHDIPESGPYCTNDREFTLEWEDSPSWSDMNISYFIRIGTREWGGDVLEWTDVGPDPEMSISSLDLDIGVYSVQLMAGSNGNFSRVTRTTLKFNDYQVDVMVPEDMRSYRGKGVGARFALTNFATLQDNVTVRIDGDIVDKGYAFMTKSGEREAEFELASQKNLTIPAGTVALVTIFPARDAEKGTYTLRMTVVSEDGVTTIVTENVSIRVMDRPEEGAGGEITDTLYDLITDILPFLRPVSKNLLVPIFLGIVLIIVAAIAVAGILLYRSRKKVTKEDPYAEQRQLYKELYGTEPTKEQLEKMASGSIVEDIMKDAGEVQTAPEGPKKTGFDESFLGSEKGKTADDNEKERA